MGEKIMVQNNFSGGVVSPSLYIRTDMPFYDKGCMQLENMLIEPYGGVRRRGGLEYICTLKEEALLMPFTGKDKQGIILEFSDRCLRFIKNGEFCRKPERDGPIIELVTPYTKEHFAGIQCVQVESILYIVHERVRPYKLIYTEDYQWALEPLLFGCTLDAIKDLSVQGEETDATCSYYVVAVDAQCREGRVGNTVTKNCVPSIHTPVRLQWKAVQNADMYHVYVQLPGEPFFSLYDRVKSTSVDLTEMNYMGVLERKKRHPSSGGGSFPRAVACWQQRLIFAGSKEEPQSLWASKVGDFNTIVLDGTVLDDSPIAVTMADGMRQDIEWLFPYREQLLVGTSAGEYVLYGKNGAVTPSTIQISQQTRYGVSKLPPLYLGDMLAFVQKDRKTVRSIQYTAEYESFLGTNLSILAQHLTENASIVQWAWQQSTQNVVWCVLDNGVMLGMTFIREYGVVGWHIHKTDGHIHSVAVIQENGEDRVYVLVSRIVNGDRRYCVERLERIEEKSIACMVRTPKESILPDIQNHIYPQISLANENTVAYMDSFIHATVIDNKVCGLEHLEGKSVCVKVEDFCYTDIPVINGTVTLPDEATVVAENKNCIVGLCYTSILVPMLTNAIVYRDTGRNNGRTLVLFVHTFDEGCFVAVQNTEYVYAKACTEGGSLYNNFHSITPGMKKIMVALHNTTVGIFPVFLMQYFPRSMYITGVEISYT